MSTTVTNEDMTEIIFENYANYIQEHNDEIGSVGGALEMLSSDGSFNSYVESLTEGLPSDVKKSVLLVANREREFLLEESINVGASASVIGYAVTYFPILTDIYADPVLTRVATIYPTNKAIVTIPRVQVKASVKNSDGTTSSFTIPREQNLVRASAEIISASPTVSNNLFSLSSGGLVTPDNSVINKRYLFLKNIDVSDGTGTFNVAMTHRPDIRGQINKEFTFTDTNSESVTGTIIGNVNWESGVVSYNVTYVNNTNPNSTTVYSTTKLDLNVVFSPKTGDVGRVKVKIEMEGHDVNIDIKDDFEIDLETETIQDYRDIYNIDMVRTMSLAIKHQILLNKDFDLAFFLSTFEPEMAANGASITVDLVSFRDTKNFISPNNVIDIFRSVIPAISGISRTIRKNFRAAPQYLLAGIKTAALLETLQAYHVNMTGEKTGEAGFAANAAMDFRRMSVLSSAAIAEEKIYLIYKSPSDDLSRSAIVDLVYKPLYIIEEVTNSQKRVFVKSRTSFEFVRTEALGVITITDLPKYFA